MEGVVGVNVAVGGGGRELCRVLERGEVVEVGR